MKKVYFVRHGESELNVHDREQGAAGALSELGRRQAEFIAQRLAPIPLDIIITSPYERTRETAGIINATLNKEIVECPFLTERKPPTQFIGVANDDPEYKKVKALMSEKRKLDPAWKYADEDSFIDLKTRASSALNYLRERPEQTIVAVTHAGILRMIVGCVIFGDELTYPEYLKMYWALKSQNTGITLVEDDNRPTTTHPGWKLITWNDHAHLE